MEEIFKEDELDTKTLVVFMAGEGTRLLPYTEVLPKPLMPIGETDVRHSITKFYNQNFNQFIISINYKLI